MSELPEAHEDVLNVAMSVPETDNLLVHLDLLRIAGNLPPVQAAQLAERAPQWIRAGTLLTSDRAAAALISHLANGGQTARALELTRVFFEILPPNPNPAGEGWPRDVRTRLERGMYGELIRTVREPLVGAQGWTPCVQFCSLLEAAVAASRASDDEEEVEDYSFVWRPGIDGSRNTYDDVRNSLIETVRDSALDFSAASDDAVKQVVDILMQHRFTVFGRIALFVLRERPVLPIIEAMLTNRGNFDALGFRREYALLLRDFFLLLSGGAREQLLAWLTETPNTDLDESDCRRLQLERLAPLAGMLPAKEQALLDQLVQEFGTPEPPDVISPQGTFLTGPKSPKSAEELTAMPDDDLIRFLKEWKPTGHVMADSPEGLGRMLQSAASRDPKRFVTVATRFQDLSPTYVRSAIQGFHEAVRQGRPFPWEPVLNLCAWALQQPYITRRSTGRIRLRKIPAGAGRVERSQRCSTPVSKLRTPQFQLHLRTLPGLSFRS